MMMNDDEMTNGERNERRRGKKREEKVEGDELATSDALLPLYVVYVCKQI